MSKPKTISLEQLRSHKEPLQRTIMWHGIAVTVRTILPMSEAISFVDGIMKACYDKTHDIIMPEVMDFAFRFYVVTSYAHVEMPDNIEEQYELLYCTDVFDVIANAVNHAQLKSLRDTVSSLLFRTDQK